MNNWVFIVVFIELMQCSFPKCIVRYIYIYIFVCVCVWLCHAKLCLVHASKNIFYFRCLKNLCSSTSSDMDSGGDGQGKLTAKKQ